MKPAILYLTTALLLALNLPLPAQENESMATAPAATNTPAATPEPATPVITAEPSAATPPQAEAPATAPAPAATPAPIESVPTAKPEAKTPAPTTPSTPKVEKEVPHAFGDRTGQVYIGHRAVVDRYTGWGWIWKEGEGYRRGKWVLMQEEPGVRMVPGRFYSHPESDKDMEYKIYGEFLPFKGYEPNYDVYADVFRIKGFEVIGKADPLNLRPPAASSGKARNSSSSRVHEISID